MIEQLVKGCLFCDTLRPHPAAPGNEPWLPGETLIHVCAHSMDPRACCHKVVSQRANVTTNKLLLFAAHLLDIASDEFGNHGCNDLDLTPFFTQEEIKELILAYHSYNKSSPQEIEDAMHNIASRKFHYDFAMMGFMADRLRTWAAQVTNKEPIT